MDHGLKKLQLFYRYRAIEHISGYLLGDGDMGHAHFGIFPTAGGQLNFTVRLVIGPGHGETRLEVGVIPEEGPFGYQAGLFVNGQQVAVIGRYAYFLKSEFYQVGLLTGLGLPLYFRVTPSSRNLKGMINQ